MMTLAKMILYTTMAQTVQTKNPVKLSVLLMLGSAFMFGWTSQKTGEVWFPLLMFLMFMGGILMMFMILSAVLPNEKGGKTWAKSIIFLFFLLEITLKSNEPVSEGSMQSIKSMLDSSSMVEFMFSLLTLYFLVVIFLIKDTKMPLRSFSSCQKYN